MGELCSLRRVTGTIIFVSYRAGCEQVFVFALTSLQHSGESRG